MVRSRKYLVVLAGLCGWILASCSNQEAMRARDVAQSRLKCPMGDVAVGLNRQTPQVREWVVGCNFMYMRVHCKGNACYPARPKPPCVGDMPCFEEDPVTLDWTLAKNGH